MLTTQSRRGQRPAEETSNKTVYTKLLRHVSLLTPNNWAAHYDDIPHFGERQIEALCIQLKVGGETAILGYCDLPSFWNAKSTDYPNLVTMI